VSTDQTVTPEVAETPAFERERESIKVETERFASRVCQRHPGAFTQPNATATKKAVIRQIKISLPPHPGRPRKARVTRACELKRQGIPWREIYRQCIPGYATLKRTDRHKEILRLRNAARARPDFRRRPQRKNSSLISSNKKKDGPLFAPISLPILTK
jgi:hypothetical protein